MARRWLGLALLSLLAAVAVGCGGPGGLERGDGPGNPGDERGSAADAEETTASGGGRTASEATRRPIRLDAEAVSGGRAYLPAGFGEGSLWVTDPFTCDDTSVVGASGVSEGGSASSSAAACAVPEGTAQPLRRLDPRNGREVAEIPLENFFANTTEVVSGAGSVWVSSGDYYSGPVDDSPSDAVFRIDPRTNRVVDRIPVGAPSGVAFGLGSVWVTSAGYGTLSRIDPDTGDVAAEIEVGRGAVDVAVDERSGVVWVAGLYLFEDYDESAAPEDPEDKKLSRVDPATNRVVAEVPISAGAQYGGAQNVAVGEGSVWAASGDGKLFEVDPRTNEVANVVPLGDYPSDLEVSGGAVWATVQEGTSSETHLVQVDPRTNGVVGSESLGPVQIGGYGRLVAGGGYIWFVSGAERTKGGTLARVAP